MLRTHRIALVPNREQERLLREHVGYARFAWNWGLARFEARDKDAGEWLNGFVLRPEFNQTKGEIAAWGTVLSQNASKNALLDLHKAIELWGSYRKALKAGKKPRFVGHPQFRSKHDVTQSYQADNGPGTVKIEGRRIMLPKVGAIKMREALRFEGSVRKVVVKHDGHRWFACVIVETAAPEPVPPQVDAAGVDVGITHLAVVAYSDNQTEWIENPKHLQHALRELRKTDKAIARSKKVHGKNKSSNRRNRLYEKRRRLHRQIANKRGDHQHKTTTSIAKRAGSVGVETLNVEGMKRNRRLARAISDAGMSGWLTTLEHKAQWHQREFKRADCWLPSSKTCSACGHKKAVLQLSERTYRCHSCGHTIDRDLNAARNLLAEVQPKRGDDISPVRGNGQATVNEA